MARKIAQKLRFPYGMVDVDFKLPRFTKMQHMALRAMSKFSNSDLDVHFTMTGPRRCGRTTAALLLGVYLAVQKYVDIVYFVSNTSMRSSNAEFMFDTLTANAKKKLGGKYVLNRVEFNFCTQTHITALEDSKIGAVIMDDYDFMTDFNKSRVRLMSFKYNIMVREGGIVDIEIDK
jgi:hypothetical protein